MKAKVNLKSQVKCNFCFNWFSGANLSKKNINSCDNCLTKYSKSISQVCTSKQQCYYFYFFLQKQNVNINSANNKVKNQDQACIQEQQKIKKTRKLTSLNQQTTQNIKQSQIYQISSPKDQQNANISIVEQAQTLQNKIQNTWKSQLIIKQLKYDYSQKNNRFNQSSFFEKFSTPAKSKVIKQRFFSLQRINADYQNFASNLSKSRLQQKYQFYHDQNAIQDFIQVKSKKSKQSQMRQFGQQLGINSIQRHKNHRHIGQRSKTHQSILSIQSLNSQYCGHDEQSRNKVSSFLEIKMQPQINQIVKINIQNARALSQLKNGTLELRNFKLNSSQLQLYLKYFQYEVIQSLNLINMGLTDNQIPVILSFIQNKPIKYVSLASNNITELSVPFFVYKDLPFLRRLHLQNNKIQRQKQSQQIAQLESKLLLFL